MIKKLTDHHAIIPTGIQTNLQYNQQQVYDSITRRFIAVFYPDSEVANTAVIGKASEVPFKTSGKEIITQGWRVVFAKEESAVKKKSTNSLFYQHLLKEKKGHTNLLSYKKKPNLPKTSQKPVCCEPWKLLENK